MRRFLSVSVIGVFAVVQGLMAQTGQLAASSSTVSTGGATAKAKLVDVPPLPPGKSTIFGGQIRNIDQVRDQFTLNVYGMKPLKILYDARTEIFRNGEKISLLQLTPADHASVQTTLDGAKVFAISVHILANAPEGDYQGRVVSYDPATGILSLAGGQSQGAFHVHVTSATTVKREGQSTFTAENRGQNDLVRDALVTLTFEPAKGQGFAKEITILATPGSSFVFSGTITALNVAGGDLTVEDPRDGRSYQIHFDNMNPVARDLHQGDKVRIAADYDGTRYAATQIAKQ